MRYLTYFGVAGLLEFFLVGWLTLASQNSDAKLVENDIIQAFFKCCFNFALLRFHLAAPGVPRQHL